MFEISRLRVNGVTALNMGADTWLHCGATLSLYAFHSADARIELFHMRPDEMWWM